MGLGRRVPGNTARRWARSIALAALFGALLANPASAAADPTLSAGAGPAEITFGGSTTIAGALSGNPGGDGGVTLELRRSQFPYGSSSSVDTTRTGPDGSYSFSAAPDRNSRYVVAMAGSPLVQSSQVQVTVDEKVTTHIRFLSLGRARIVIESRHPADLNLGQPAGLLVSGGEAQLPASRPHTQR
jgi:hypothetical protein